MALREGLSNARGICIYISRGPGAYRKNLRTRELRVSLAECTPRRSGGARVPGVGERDGRVTHDAGCRARFGATRPLSRVSVPIFNCLYCRVLGF